MDTFIFLFTNYIHLIKISNKYHFLFIIAYLFKKVFNKNEKIHLLLDKAISKP